MDTWWLDEQGVVGKTTYFLFFFLNPKKQIWGFIVKKCNKSSANCISSTPCFQPLANILSFTGQQRREPIILDVPLKATVKVLNSQPLLASIMLPIWPLAWDSLTLDWWKLLLSEFGPDSDLYWYTSQLEYWLRGENSKVVPSPRPLVVRLSFFLELLVQIQAQMFSPTDCYDLSAPSWGTTGLVSAAKLRDVTNDDTTVIYILTVFLMNC